MTTFASLADLRAACLDLPAGDAAAADGGGGRQAKLTKPPRSLGRLEDMVAWLARWQGRSPPRLERVDILVFAGNHGVTAQGVSAYPAEVTAQMVANFAAGGAAINQLARTAGASLRVIPLSLDRPTADFTQAPAMDEAAFLAAVTTGYDAVSPDADLVCLGEMGIGNTTAAAAIAAALFGGGAARWAGRGTGIDDAGSRASERSSISALARHAAALQRSAVDRGGVGRTRACRDSRRDLGGAAAAHSGAARRLRLHGGGGAAGEAARRCARSCAWRVTSRPKPGIACCSTSSVSRRCSISACGSAKARARRWRCWCCARRSPATPAWRPSPRPGCRTSRRDDRAASLARDIRSGAIA